VIHVNAKGIRVIGRLFDCNLDSNGGPAVPMEGGILEKAVIHEQRLRGF
jgi:hypothetical protein